MEKLPCLLNDASRRFANLPAVLTEQKEVSFAELEALVQGTQQALLEKGVKKGDIVGLILANGLECLVLLFALIRIGGIAAPINTRFPKQQIEDLLSQLETRFVVTDQESRQDYPSSFQVFTCQELIKPKTGQPTVRPSQEGNYRTAKEGNLPTVRSSQEGDLLEKILIAPNQPVTIIFTSGSSGAPKAALHCYKNHYYNALGSNENIPIAPNDRWLLSLPQFHVGGLAIIFRTLLGGGTVVILENAQDPANHLEPYQITHVSLVNTQLLRLLKEVSFEEKKLNLKAILLGGGPLSPDLLKQATERNLPVFTSYGLTEMSSQIATTPPGASLEELQTAGTPLKYRSIKISQEGEILTRGETLFLGYLSQQKLTAPVDEEGWFHTGDRGFLKNDSLTLLGRMDRMFISGGENIYPEEIERAFSAIPEVEQIVVVPVNDEEYGLRPAAFLKMQNAPIMTRERALSQLGEVLARYKIPDYYFPWPEEVENQSLKISYKQMKELAQKNLFLTSSMN